MLLLKKLRKVTMFREKLRSARKIANLMLTLKSNLVVADCWHVFHLALDNVAGPTGMLKRLFVLTLYSLSFAFLIFSNLCRYILEGKELEFYMKKLQKKKGKGAA